MEIADEIIRYLKETYSPKAIIVYGSFADGSANAHSDFDALVIADHVQRHDASVIGGIPLDVFLEPIDALRAELHPEDFVQIWDGKIVLDTHGIAARLQAQVRVFLERAPKKTADEIEQEIGWCEKMLLRAERNDAEGLYRWHWLLTDSLEIYCDVKGLPYFGPKKALRRMEQSDAEAFRLYAKALSVLERDSLREWVAYLRRTGSALRPRDL